MKNTFRENDFVCKDFLSTVKKTSCIKNIGVLVVYGKQNNSSNFRDRTKLMLPLDLARFRVNKSIQFVHPSSKKIYILFRTSLHFLTKKSNFRNLFKKNYH